MRLHRVAGLIVLIGLVGCGQRDVVSGGGGGGGGRTHPAVKKDRPIVIVLSQKKNGNDCEAKFGDLAQHAFNDDDVLWQFVNNCDSDQTPQIELKNHGPNPFTTAAPWNKLVKAGKTDNIRVTVGDAGTVASGKVYEFDIVINGHRYDPKLEIDP